MSIEVDRGSIAALGTQACSVCGGQVNELRRGRCWNCYTRWTELRPVGRGASCNICGELRRDNLRMVELHGKSIPLCHNCSSRSLKLQPMPHSLDEIRSLLDRERRDEERRGHKRDHRLFPRERRVSDRRSPVELRGNDATDPAIFFPIIEEVVIELDDTDIEVLEQTLVREAPRHA